MYKLTVERVLNSIKARFFSLKVKYRYYLARHKKNVELLYKNHTGIKLNLESPVTFNQKLQWLKLYWCDDLAVKCADKYLARFEVEKRGCPEILNELYGVWEDADDIDFDKLPDSFVLKVNHGCGFNIFCRDKSQLDMKKTRKQLNQMLRQKYYMDNYEWVYAGIKPKIICEKLLTSDGFPVDYKFFCFNGEVKCIFVAMADANRCRKHAFFDLNFNKLPIVQQHSAYITQEVQKPERLEDMIQYAKLLSKGFPHVRIDFYEIDGKVIFGEFTFFHSGGYLDFEPQEWQKTFGGWLVLPK